MKTVALYGGSFDPPHAGHVMVVTWLASCSGVDEVWVLPSFKHALKVNTASFDDRLEMCNLAFGGLCPKVKVLDYEKRNYSDYSVELVSMCQTLHRGVQFRFVVGSDILAERDRWYEFDRLCRLAPLIVIPRPPWCMRAMSIPIDTLVAPVVFPDLTSSQVRFAVSHGGVKNVPTGLVPNTVLTYMAARGLYLPVDEPVTQTG